MKVAHLMLWVTLATAATGCSSDRAISMPSEGGLPLDFTQSRLASVAGNRLEIEGVLVGADELRRAVRGGRGRGGGHGGGRGGGRGVDGGAPSAASPGDWAYDVGGPVNGGVAILTASWGASASCADRLFVPVNTSTGNNVWAFDNLYPSIPGGTGACVNGGSDGGRCSSPYCPRRVWTAALSGAIDRSSLTLSLDGRVVYAATTNGVLYALDTSTGATVWSLDTRSSTELGSSSNAYFRGGSPWVDYGSGNVYVAASYGTSSAPRFRIYKVSPTGVVLARWDSSTLVPEAVEASVVVWAGALYVGTTIGRVHKLFDNGATLTPAPSPWPVQLTAKGSVRNRLADVRGTIYGTPSIDIDNDLLGITVNNVMWTVNLSTGAKQSVEGGWQNVTEAVANNVTCYSSPWIDPTIRTMFVAHGKNQNTPESERNRVHRREYFTSGVFRTDNLTSVPTAGVGNPVSLTDPKSSPLVLRQSPSLAWVYVGDAGGILNRWDYGTEFSNRQTFNTGAGPAGAIETPIMVDVLGGFIYFGSNAGRVYQIGQSTLR
jgi:hypothetical protein